MIGRDGTFITGTDLLIDGGVIASIAAGPYQLSLGWNMPAADAGPEWAEA